MQIRASRSLRVAGLFAGVGGIELGLERAGHRVEWLCEIDPIAAAILKEKFDRPALRDIRTVKRLPVDIDLVAAGFPCQDLSAAGQSAGITGAKSGLVMQILRLLGFRPKVPWVVLENVPFMLRLQHGRAMHLITTELEKRGYRWAYRVVDARAFGLPQRRQRVLLVASLDDDPRDVLLAEDAIPPMERHDPPDWRLAHGFYWTEGNRGLGWAVNAVPPLKGGSSFGIPSPPAIVLPRDHGNGRIVIPHIQDAERLQGFEPGWTARCVDLRAPRARWRMVGNAVPVSAAEWLGRRIACPGIFLGDGRPLTTEDAWPDAAWGASGRRFAVDVSPWPVTWARPPLAEFLIHDGQPLSLRATRGFRERLERSSLRKPDGLLALLLRHEKFMNKRSAAASRAKKARCDDAIPASS